MQPLSKEIETNVGTAERWGSVVGGSGLLLYALRSRILRVPALLVGGGLLWRGISGHSVTYRSLGLNTVTPEKKEIEVEQAVTINRSPEAVYEFWRKLENLPTFMHYLEWVRPEPDGRSRWKAKIPGPLPLEWEARIVEDEPNRLIAWETEPDSMVDHRGVVQFKPAPGERGTELRVNLTYSPPGGVVGEGMGQLLNSVTAQQIKEEIRRCKRILETGEVPTIDGQPAGH